MGQNRFILLDARHSGNEALSKATPRHRIAVASNGGNAGLDCGLPGPTITRRSRAIAAAFVRENYAHGLAGHSIIGSRK